MGGQPQPVCLDALQGRRRRADMEVIEHRFRVLGAFAGHRFGFLGGKSLDAGSKPGTVGDGEILIRESFALEK